MARFLSSESAPTLQSILICQIILISISIPEVTSSRHQTAPKIQLKAFVEEDEFEVKLAKDHIEDINEESFESELIIKNGSDYTLKDNVREVIFGCEGSYPVMWKMPHPENFNEMTTFRVGRFSVATKTTSTFTETMNEPENDKYFAYLSVRTSFMSQIGYLSCQPANHHDSQERSTIYIWNEGEGLIDDDIYGTQNITTDLHQTHFVIPCRPKKSDAKLLLEKKKIVHKSFKNVTEKWVPIKQSDYVTFDPKVGFTIDKDGLRSVPGSYRCSIIPKDDDEQFNTSSIDHVSPYIYYDVSTGVKTEPSYEFVPKMSVNPPARFNMTNMQIECCSGSGGEITGDQMGCNSGAECEFFKEAFIRENMFKSDDTSIGSRGCYSMYMDYFNHAALVYCKGNNIEVVGEYVSLQKKKTPKVDGRYGLSISDLYETFDANSEIDVERKILTRLRQPRTVSYNAELPYIRHHPYRVSGAYYSDIHYGYHGRYGGNIDNFMMMEEQKDRGSDYGSRYMRSSLLYDYVPVGNTLYEGMEVAVYCIAESYFYSFGGWLALNWRNGSKTVFKGSNAADVEKEDFVLVSEKLASSRLLIGRILNVQADMESIDCFVPPWNRMKWEKITHKLVVNASSPPEFDNPKDEHVSLKLGEHRVKINCSVISTEQDKALPVTIDWEKDGKVLSKYQDNNIADIYSSHYFGKYNDTYSVLILKNVSLESHGKYFCKATNAKGSIEKMFRVFVIDEVGDKRRNMVIITAVVGSIILTILVGVIIFLSRKHWKSQVKIRNFASNRL